MHLHKNLLNYSLRRKCKAQGKLKYNNPERTNWSNQRYSTYRKKSWDYWWLSAQKQHLVWWKSVYHELILSVLCWPFSHFTWQILWSMLQFRYFYNPWKFATPICRWNNLIISISPGIFQTNLIRCHCLQPVSIACRDNLRAQPACQL